MKTIVPHMASCEGAGSSLLHSVLKSGAQQLLLKAIEAEVSGFIQHHAHLIDGDDHRCVVRNGYAPERSLTTPLGQLRVRMPRVRDSRNEVRFQSTIVPPYLRRTKELDELVPWLYLKGVSTGDFTEALGAIVGSDAKGFSANTVVRLKEKWFEEHKEWSTRSLSGKRYLYFWVDGVYFNLRLEGERQCILVILGVTEDGTKELIAVEDGVRESELSWTSLLLSLKDRGLEISPSLAIGDGALGFWKALRKVYPTCAEQRCWVHKTANVLDKLPKTAHEKAKDMLKEIYAAENRGEAEKAFARFLETYEGKYPKAAECLSKDKVQLFTFFSFPSEHWYHIRSTNAVESVFATVRLRHRKTKGSAKAKECLAMVFKLCESASKRWKKLRRAQLLLDVASGVTFVDGVKIAA